MKATVPPKKETGGFRIKRVYAPAAADDGLRVLVDRLYQRLLPVSRPCAINVFRLEAQVRVPLRIEPFVSVFR